MPSPEEVRPVKIPKNDRALMLAMAACKFGVKDVIWRNLEVVRIATYIEEPKFSASLNAIFDGLGTRQKLKDETAGFFLHRNSFHELLDPLSYIVDQKLQRVLLLTPDEFYPLMFGLVYFGMEEGESQISFQSTRSKELSKDERRQIHYRTWTAINEHVAKLGLRTNPMGRGIELGEVKYSSSGAVYLDLSQIPQEEMKAMVWRLRNNRGVGNLRLLKPAPLAPIIEKRETEIEQVLEAWMSTAREIGAEKDAARQMADRWLRGEEPTSEGNPGSRLRNPVYLKPFSLPFEFYLPERV